MDIAADLLRDIEAFMAAHEMTATRFGLEAVNDGHFVRRLRSNGNFTIETISKVRAFMAARVAEREGAAA